MAIVEKLMKFKYYYFFGAIFSLLLLLLVLLAPRFLDLIFYFWPLLLSTALCLAAVVVFGLVSPMEPEALGEKAGEGLLDFVAARPAQMEEEEIPKSESKEETEKTTKSERKREAVETPKSESKEETESESRVSDE